MSFKENLCPQLSNSIKCVDSKSDNYNYLVNFDDLEIYTNEKLFGKNKMMSVSLFIDTLITLKLKFFKIHTK